jgi:hypothetical protein
MEITMSEEDKETKNSSNRGGTTEYPDGWNEPEVVDLRKRYKNWEDGFAVAEIQPTFPKIDDDDGK